MSRARDLANLGDGIDATQITSGVFANGRIQASNVTQHEGSIDALASNPTIALGSNATGGGGLTAHGRIGHYIKGKLNSNIQNRTGATIINQAKTWTPSGYNTDVFEGQTSGSYGLKCKLAGRYLFVWAVYAYAQSDSNPIGDAGYTQEHLYDVDAAAEVSESYVIYENDSRGYTGNGYTFHSHSCVLNVTANQTFVPHINCTSPNYHFINSSTHIGAIFLG